MCPLCGPQQAAVAALTDTCVHQSYCPAGGAVLPIMWLFVRQASRIPVVLWVCLAMLGCCRNAARVHCKLRQEDCCRSPRCTIACGAPKECRHVRVHCCLARDNLLSECLCLQSPAVEGTCRLAWYYVYVYMLTVMCRNGVSPPLTSEQQLLACAGDPCTLRARACTASYFASQGQTAHQRGQLPSATQAVCPGHHVGVWVHGHGPHRKCMCMHGGVACAATLMQRCTGSRRPRCLTVSHKMRRIAGQPLANMVAVPYGSLADLLVGSTVM